MVAGVVAGDHLGGPAPGGPPPHGGSSSARAAARRSRSTGTSAPASASDQFDRISQDREPDWMGFYDRGELLAQHGRVYRDMARRTASCARRRRGVDAAIASFGANVRSTMLNEVGLCSALSLADEPERALTWVPGVMDQARGITSRRVQTESSTCGAIWYAIG